MVQWDMNATGAKDPAEAARHSVYNMGDGNDTLSCGRSVIHFAGDLSVNLQCV